MSADVLSTSLPEDSCNPKDKMDPPARSTWGDDKVELSDGDWMMLRSSDSSRPIDDESLWKAVSSFTSATAISQALSRTPLETRTCSLLFIDITGFTSITELICSGDVFGPEDVRNAVNEYFTAVMRVVNGYGGQVINFAGDAMIVSWFAEDANVLRSAISCGLAVTSLTQQTLIPHTGHVVQWRIKAAITHGDVKTLITTCRNHSAFLLCGDMMEELSQCLDECESKSVLAVSPSVWSTAREFCDGTVGPSGCAVVSSCTHVGKVPHPSPPLERVDGRLQVASSFVPPLVLSRLRAGALPDDFSEFRKVSVLFISFSVQHDRSSLFDQYQSLMDLLVNTAERFYGMLCHFVVQEKGPVAMLAFGMPGMAEEKANLHALKAAFSVQSHAASFCARAAVGISTGRVFCGLLGHPNTRCEYTVMGDTVNLGARIMQESAKLWDGKVQAHRDSHPVLCDAATAESARTALRLTKERSVMFKGKSTSVALFRARAPTARAGSASLVHHWWRGVRCLGRAAEIETLRSRMHRFARMGEGGAVIVSAAPGLGKSTLCARALTDHLDAEPECLVVHSTFELIQPTSGGPCIVYSLVKQLTAMLHSIAAAAPPLRGRGDRRSSVVGVDGGSGHAIPTGAYLSRRRKSLPAQSPSVAKRKARPHHHLDASAPPTEDIFDALLGVSRSMWKDDAMPQRNAILDDGRYKQGLPVLRRVFMPHASSNNNKARANVTKDTIINADLLLDLSIATILRAELWLRPMGKQLMIFLEDLHWVDERNLRLVNALLAFGSELPLFILATRRPTPLRAGELVLPDFNDSMLEFGSDDGSSGSWPTRGNRGASSELDSSSEEPIMWLEDSPPGPSVFVMELAELPPSVVQQVVLLGFIERAQALAVKSPRATTAIADASGTKPKTQTIVVAHHAADDEATAHEEAVGHRDHKDERLEHHDDGMDERRRREESGGGGVRIIIDESVEEGVSAEAVATDLRGHAMMEDETEEDEQEASSENRPTQLVDELAAFVSTNCRGNPYHAHCLGTFLAESGHAEPRGSTLMLTSPISLISVPEQLEDLIMSRVDRLSPAAQVILRVASVIGTCSAPMLFRLVNSVTRGISLEQFLSISQELSASQMLMGANHLGSDDHFEVLHGQSDCNEDVHFYHQYVADTIRLSLPKDHRKRLNGLVADELISYHSLNIDGFGWTSLQNDAAWSACAAIAHHLDECGRLGKALLFHDLAAFHALNEGKHEEATTRLDRCRCIIAAPLLDELVDAFDRCDVLPPNAFQEMAIKFHMDARRLRIRLAMWECALSTITSSKSEMGQSLKHIKAAQVYLPKDCHIPEDEVLSQLVELSLGTGRMQTVYRDTSPMHYIAVETAADVYARYGMTETFAKGVDPHSFFFIGRSILLYARIGDYRKMHHMLSMAAFGHRGQHEFIPRTWNSEPLMLRAFKRISERPVEGISADVADALRKMFDFMRLAHYGPVLLGPPYERKRGKAPRGQWDVVVKQTANLVTAYDESDYNSILRWIDLISGRATMLIGYGFVEDARRGVQLLLRELGERCITHYRAITLRQELLLMVRNLRFDEAYARVVSESSASAKGDPLITPNSNPKLVAVVALIQWHIWGCNGKFLKYFATLWRMFITRWNSPPEELIYVTVAVEMMYYCVLGMLHPDSGPHVCARVKEKVGETPHRMMEYLQAWMWQRAACTPPVLPLAWFFQGCAFYVDGAVSKACIAWNRGIRHGRDQGLPYHAAMCHLALYRAGEGRCVCDSSNVPWGRSGTPLHDLSRADSCRAHHRLSSAIMLFQQAGATESVQHCNDHGACVFAGLLG